MSEESQPKRVRLRDLLGLRRGQTNRGRFDLFDATTLKAGQPSPTRRRSQDSRHSPQTEQAVQGAFGAIAVTKVTLGDDQSLHHSRPPSANNSLCDASSPRRKVRRRKRRITKNGSVKPETYLYLGVGDDEGNEAKVFKVSRSELSKMVENGQVMQMRREHSGASKIIHDHPAEGVPVFEPEHGITGDEITSAGYELSYSKLNNDAERENIEAEIEEIMRQYETKEMPHSIGTAGVSLPGLSRSDDDEVDVVVLPAGADKREQIFKELIAPHMMTAVFQKSGSGDLGKLPQETLFAIEEYDDHEEEDDDEEETSTAMMDESEGDSESCDM